MSFLAHCLAGNFTIPNRNDPVDGMGQSGIVADYQGRQAIRLLQIAEDLVNHLGGLAVHFPGWFIRQEQTRAIGQSYGNSYALLLAAR